jgi:hypothetical protein
VGSWQAWHDTRLVESSNEHQQDFLVFTLGAQFVAMATAPLLRALPGIRYANLIHVGAATLNGIGPTL